MDDQQDQIRKEFSRKMDQARLDADHLARRAREIKKIMGEMAETPARYQGESGDGGLKSEASGEGVFGPAAFPILLEDLERTLLEGEAWSGKMIQREGEFLNLLGEWEGLSGELAGIQASLSEALEGNTATWIRFAGNLRDLASDRGSLKRDQEELAALLDETAAALEEKGRSRGLLRDLVRATIREGEKQRDHLEEILADQQQISELLEGSRRLVERSLAVYGEGPGMLKRIPDILESFSAVIREMTQGIGAFYQNLEVLEKTKLTRIWDELTVQARISREGGAGRPGPGADREGGEAWTKAPCEDPGDWGKRRASLAALNERINLLALNAFIAAVQGEKRPEELAEVFGEIRMVSEQLKKELQSTGEAGPPPAPPAAGAGQRGAGAPWERSRAASGEGWYEKLETARPALAGVEQGLQDLAGQAAGLLEHLTRMNEQNQELALLAGDQARFAGRLLEGLLPLKGGLQQMSRLEADQAFRVQEIQRCLERTQSQADEVRRRLAGPGGGPALVPRLESAREIVRTLAGDLFRREQEAERLGKEGLRLRALLETVGQQAAAQGLKQWDCQETVEKVRRCHQKIRRELDTRRLAIQGVLGRVRQLVDHLEPFARESREQTLMNRTFLEALTEIRGMVKNKLS